MGQTVLSNELIVYQPDRREQHNSPWQNFLLRLRKHFVEDEIATNQGTVIWTGLPIDDVLAAGLMTALAAVQKKVGKEFSTILQRQQIMQILNPVLNTGIVLLYGDSVQAKNAFVQQVVSGVEQAIALGYRPGMKLSRIAWKSADKTAMRAEIEAQSESAPHCGSLIEFWQMPVALFFTPIIKASLDFEAAYSARAKTLQVGTKIAHAGLMIPLSDYFRGFDSSLLSRAQLLSDQPVMTHFSEAQIAAQIRDFKAEVEQLEILFAHLRALPIDLHIYPSSAFEVMTIEGGAKIVAGPRYIADAWVHTQMLLQIAGKHEERWLTTKVFMEGVEAVSCLTVREIAEEAEVRLASLGVAEQIIVGLRGYLYQRAASVKQSNSRLAEYLHENYFIEIPLHAHQLSANDALDIAAGSPRWAKLLQEMNPSDRLRVQRMLCDLIEWSRLSQDDLEYFTGAACLIPEVLIAEYVPDLGPGVDASHVMDQLIRRDGRALEVLVANESIPLTRDIVLKHANKIDKGRLETWVKAELSRENFEGRLRSIIIACNQLDSVRVQTLVERVPNRFEFVTGFIYLLANNSDCDREGVQTRERNLFVDKLGVDLWCRLILALNAHDRLGVYRLLESIEEEGYLEKWEDPEGFNHHAMFAIVRERVNDWLRRVSEVEAYAWSCHDPNHLTHSKLEVDEFKRLREAYYNTPLLKE
jgi:hypothetical protein